MLNADELHRRLDYDAATGVFVWLPIDGASAGARRWNPRYAGSVAGRVSRGRRIIRIGGADYLAHRLAWLYVHGEWPAAEIDHANRNPLDNRLANLRLASRMQQSANSTRSTRNTSGVKGVRWRADRGKWQAILKADGVYKHLGLFGSRDEAARAYAAGAADAFGEFATAG